MADPSDIRESRRRLRSTIGVPLAVLVVGLTLTGLAVRRDGQQIHAEARMQFTQLVERASNELLQGITQAASGLKGTRGLYAASSRVERHDFRDFVASHDLQREFPGTLGIGFIERVPRTELETFVARERADDAPEFAVHGSGDAPDLFFVKLIEPLEPNRAAFGYDMGSDPVRRAAVVRAIRSGELTTSARVHLLWDGSERDGLILLLPVYRDGVRPQTPEAREAALEGLVYAPIHLDGILASVLAATDGQLAIGVYDGPEILSASLLSAPLHPAAPAGGNAASVIRPPLFEGVKHIVIGGRKWSLALSSSPAFDAQIDTAAALWIGSAGGLLSALLAAFVWSIRSAGARAVALADEMTANLRAAKEVLERTGCMARVGGWDLDVATGKTLWSDEVYRIHEVPVGTAMSLAQGSASTLPRCNRGSRRPCRPGSSGASAGIWRFRSSRPRAARDGSGPRARSSFATGPWPGSAEPCRTSPSITRSTRSWRSALPRWSFFGTRLKPPTAPRANSSPT